LANKKKLITKQAVVCVQTERDFPFIVNST